MRISLIILISMLTGLSYVSAGVEFGFNEQLHEKINEKFKDGDQFSDIKIEAYRSNILQRKEEITHTITTYESKVKFEDEEEIAKELSKSDSLFAYNLILEYLERIQNSTSSSEQTHLAREIFILDYSTKVTGALKPLKKITDVVKHFPGSRTLYKTNNIEGEASNLYNEEKDEFYSQTELEDLRARGFDLSLLNPRSDGRFWYQRDIPSTDIKDVINGKSTLLYSGIDITFPENEAKFKKVRTTQSKPKLDITYRVEDPITGKKKKRTFKLKVGSEIHAEITTASLLGSMGYHTDLSRYVRDFKVTLPEGMGIDDLKKQWYTYDRFRSFDLDELVSEIGTDEQGRTYLVFIEGLIETKPKELVRLGPWAFGENGHKGLREVRAMHLFNIWVANNDIKEADNNKVVLKKNADGSYRTFQYMHDVGFSYGYILREKPHSYRWNVVSKNTPNKIDFNYIAFQPNSGFEHVTYADARWMVRKIGQFSRKQIEDAVELGGWPKDIGELLVEKMISRRNDLVKNFDLEDELSFIPFDSKVTTESGVVKNGNVVNGDFEGYTQTFGGEVGDLLGPTLKTIEKLIIQAAREVPRVAKSTVISAQKLGIDSVLVGEIELVINRDIIANPHPIGIDDNFIVQDTFKIRYILGAGLIVRGKGAYFQEFKLIYPVKTYEEGMYHNKFIFNALLPKTIKSGKLPENYVLLVGQGMEGEGEILLGTNIVGASASVSFAKGKMGGTIISKKPNEYTVTRDTTNYDRLMGRIYAELLILRIPVIEKSITKGSLFREAYRVDLTGDDPETREYKLNEMKRFAKTGSFGAIKDFGRSTELRSDFVTKRFETNLFIYNYRNSHRTDFIKRVAIDKKGDVDVDTIYQVEILRKQSWKVFNGEVKSRLFRFKGEIEEDGRIEEPLLDIKLRIEDDETTDRELRDFYIKSINHLALNSKFIQFTPELYSLNNVWGINHINLRMIYNKAALDKLMNTSEQEYYELMAKYSNMGVDYWSRKKRDDTIDRRTEKIKRKFQKFVDAMMKARNQNFDKEKYKIVIKAFDNIISQKGNAFEITLLQRVHSIIGRDGYFFEGHITIPDSKEMRYPEKTPLYNVMNPEIFLEQKFIDFEFEDVLEAWELYF